MSNAEQAWKKAWDECLKKAAEGDYQVDHGSFMDGYKAGRADAWQLPEVRADELVMEEWYLGKNILINKWEVFQHDQNTEAAIQFAPEQFSFRGPLPLGDA